MRQLDEIVCVHERTANIAVIFWMVNFLNGRFICWNVKHFSICHTNNDNKKK